ncbi:hypothetical protein EIN_091800 [Entamoeba invadens IP1]|uniref:F-box domain-containing protein n=1 Tax=Entamoeba invadens IP1 TaxID=370355 RepID=A0A0A1U4I8_ENTIV|nr:hypothetical protein EIN_091800 [Entamoeba invadens IP1]ELP86625.1 hypothetical protein EIN_091800 [Entamoeba invadens IP1]|eukprot:XP_004185971.1 hypothetical protein EIN_091800 [Entamoeba invadens IP1]
MSSTFPATQEDVEKMNAPVIESLLNDLDVTQKGWVKRESCLTPPPKYFQIYTKEDTQSFTLRLTALLPQNFEKVSQLMLIPKNVLSMMFLVKRFHKVTENEVDLDAASDALGICERLRSWYVLKKYKRSCIFSQTGYTNGPWISHIHLCEQNGPGVKYTIDTNVRKIENYISIEDFLVSDFAFFFEEMNDRLNGDDESIFIWDKFHEFLGVLTNTVIYPKLVIHNEKVSIFANEDYTELFVRGRVGYHKKNISDVISMYSSTINQNFNYPVFKEIRKSKKLHYVHGETRNFMGASDFVYGSVVVEYGLFVVGSSGTDPECKFGTKSDHDKFYDMLSGDLVLFGRNETTIDTVTHLCIPSHRLQTEKQAKNNILMFNVCLLLSRISLDFGIHPGVPYPFQDQFLYNFQLFQKCFVTKLLSERLCYNYRSGYYNLNTPKKAFESTKSPNFTSKSVLKCCNEQMEHRKDSFTLLDDKTLIFIFSFLSLEAIIAVKHTCKVLYGFVTRNPSIYKQIYTTHFDPKSFFRTPQKVFTYEISDIQNLEKATVNAWRVRKNWRMMRGIKHETLKLTICSIDQIQFSMGRSILAVSRSGNSIHKLNSDMSVFGILKPNDQILSTRYDWVYRNFAVATADHYVRYYNRPATAYVSKRIPIFSGINFISERKMVGLNVSEGYLYNIEAEKMENIYRPDRTPLTYINETDNGNIVTLTESGNVTWYDKRSPKIVLQTKPFSEAFVTFDSFGDYLIAGDKSGKIVMFDQRNPDTYFERIVGTKRIKQICMGCHRFSVLCENVSSFECYQNWFGRQSLLVPQISNAECILFNQEYLAVGDRNGVIHKLYFDSNVN